MTERHQVDLAENRGHLDRDVLDVVPGQERQIGVQPAGRFPLAQDGLPEEIQVEPDTGSTALGPEVREVVLTVTVSAKYGEATIFLVEVKQAGLFVIRNFTEEDTKRAVSTYCPGVLFPYARAAISHLVTQGGFPQFLLPPVNFEALYAANQQPPPTTN